LKTLEVRIEGPEGIARVRELIDEGSQRSYIKRSLMSQLGLEAEGGEEIIHSLFSAVNTSAQHHERFKVTNQNVKGAGHMRLTVLDQVKICERIPRVESDTLLKELNHKGIFIQDVGSDFPDIKLLIGADSFQGLMTGQLVDLKNGLTAGETVLGWTIIGKPSTAHENIAMTVTNMSICSSNVQQLWDLETIGIMDPAQVSTKKEKEEAAKKRFLENISQSRDGRYKVGLPWINGKQRISDNRQVAEARLESMSKKLALQQRLESYGKIFKAWEIENIIEVVPEEELKYDSHYIPHRAVLKPESTKTPIRPVFDASCGGQRSPSLNDCLETGPNLMELIPAVLMRFPKKKYGIISDVRKAFQMMDVKKEDRDFLRFLW